MQNRQKLEYHTISKGMQSYFLVWVVDFLSKYLKISQYLSQAISFLEKRRNAQPKKAFPCSLPAFPKMKVNQREILLIQWHAITWKNKCGRRNKKGGPYLNANSETIFDSLFPLEISRRNCSSRNFFRNTQLMVQRFNSSKAA